MSATPLTSSAWQQIEQYLDEALLLEGSERKTWLAELTSTQPAIAQTLRGLLDERDALNASGFLDGSPLGSTPLAALHDSRAGKQIGAYRIERRLGRGGMGEVWLASRNDGRFEGHFAIKFLERHVGQSKLVERFRREGRLLARLGHPNIARLIDAGATEDGEQFLVLEYVDGEHIDRYCASAGLSVAGRVQLFLDAVAAVAHAHSQLVVHRDLKPSNVLVTRDGAVKLLDFGIAKLLNAEPMHVDSTSTRIEDIALTPEYAAPEQLLGEMPSTATDVYQLGLLLYVLLTGTHPLLSLASRAERVRAALDGRIPHASELTSGALSKHLRGDLDAILAVALQCDPLRRYPTAAALREDLVRYLNREPVSARRGTALYRARKFINRHLFAVLGSATAIVALCATLIFALGQADVAATERDRALDLASRNEEVTDFLGMLITEAAEADKPVTVNGMLARSEKLAWADTSSSPENRAAVLAMIASRYSTLSRDGETARLLKQALQLVRESPDHALRAKLACDHALAIASLGDRPAGARAIEAVLDTLPADSESAPGCLLNRSLIAGDDHDATGTLLYAKQGLERFHHAPIKTAAQEAVLLGTLAYGHHLEGRNREADHYYALALRKLADLGRGHGPDAISIRNNWAIVIDEAGVPKRGLELYEEMLRILAQRAPNEAPPAYLIGNRASSLESVGRYGEARAAHEQALQLSTERQDMYGQAHSLLGLASVAQRMNDNANATEHLHRLAALLDPTVPRGTPPWLARSIILGRIDTAAGRYDSAKLHFTEALQGAGTAKNSTFIAASLGKAEAELQAGDAAAAAADAQAALNAATSQQGDAPYSDQTGHSWLLLGRALQKLGDEVQAQRAFTASAANLANTVDEIHPVLLQARRLAAAPAMQMAP